MFFCLQILNLNSLILFLKCFAIDSHCYSLEAKSVGIITDRELNMYSIHPTHRAMSKLHKGMEIRDHAKNYLMNL